MNLRKKLKHFKHGFMISKKGLHQRIFYFPNSTNLDHDVLRAITGGKTIKNAIKGKYLFVVFANC